jgi:hypothetical protein
MVVPLPVWPTIVIPLVWSHVTTIYFFKINSSSKEEMQYPQFQMLRVSWSGLTSKTEPNRSGIDADKRSTTAQKRS